MTIYYVRPTNGSDGNPGTSFANAFATFQKALDSLTTAGDEVRLCPEATETTAVQIDIDTTAGTSASPMLIRPGNTSDGSLDLSLTYTIQASSTITALLNIGASMNYYRYWNIAFDGNSNVTNCVTTSDTGLWAQKFNNCSFFGATGDGVLLDAANAGYLSTTLVNCESYSNGGCGLGDSGRSVLYNAINCSFHDNTSSGYEAYGSGSVVVNCISYDNGGDGFDFGSSVGNIIVGNTAYGNTGDGISITGANNANIISNNTCSSNGAYGFVFHTDHLTENVYADYNHTYNNTSGAYSPSEPGSNNQTGDPLFTSVTDGSEDFTPGSGSPLLNAGLGRKN